MTRTLEFGQAHKIPEGPDVIPEELLLWKWRMVTSIVLRKTKSRLAPKADLHVRP